VVRKNSAVYRGPVSCQILVLTKCINTLQDSKQRRETASVSNGERFQRKKGKLQS